MSLAWTLFDSAFSPFRRRALADILLLPPDPIPSGPIAFVANHASWWDGFLLRELQRTIAPQGRPHTVMLDRELRTRPYLRTLGAVGIEPGDTGSLKAALRQLDRARQRVDGRFCLFFFPQGRIWPSHRRPLGFVAGCSRFVERLAPISVVPVALHIEPLNRLAPTACVRAGTPIFVGAGEAAPNEQVLESRITELLDRTIALAARTGEGLPEAWA